MASHSPKGVYRLVVLSSINYCKCKYSVKVTKWLLQKLLQQANSVWPFALSMSGYCVWRSTLQTAAPLQAICAKWKPSLGGSSAASLASVDLSCVFGWRSTLRSHVCTQRFWAPTTVQCFKRVKFIETCTMHIEQFHFCAVSRGRQICYCGNFIQNVNKVTWASLQVLLSLALPGLK